MRKIKNILLAGFLLAVSVMTTGCGIKFIEKVEPTQTEKPTENYGDIIIEPTTEPTKKPVTEPTGTPDTSHGETPEPVGTDEPEIEPDFTFCGIGFLNSSSLPTLYVSQDYPAKETPELFGKDVKMLYRGDSVVMLALSIDEKWAQVKMQESDRISMYVNYSCLTYDQVIVPPQVTDLPSPTPYAPLETEEPIQTQAPPTQEPTAPPTQAPTEEPVDDYAGIGFPSNASSTSYNMGVEFADVTITLRVRRGGAVVSNGPEEPSSSSGYYTIANLKEGSSIKCTGIGRNGYVRVEYNGDTGYIDGRSVEY